MLELFNLKKLKQMDIGSFSNNLVYDPSINYEAKASHFDALNAMTLDKVKDMSFKIELLKSSIKSLEKRHSHSRCKSKKRVRRTKKELKLTFKVNFHQFHFF